jgi:hypothetical protein
MGGSRLSAHREGWISSVRLETYRRSEQIFTAFTVIILLWCVVLLSLSCFYRLPEVISVFPELDLASKIPVPPGDEGLCGIARLVRTKPREIVRQLHGVMVQVVEQVERDGIELRDRYMIGREIRLQ